MFIYKILNNVLNQTKYFLSTKTDNKDDTENIVIVNSNDIEDSGIDKSIYIVKGERFLELSSILNTTSYKKESLDIKNNLILNRILRYVYSNDIKETIMVVNNKFG